MKAIDAEYYYSLDEEELYRLLVPDGQSQLYSKGGAIEFGKTLYLRNVERVRQIVCPLYLKNKSRAQNAIALVALIAGALIDAAIFKKIPACAFAALLVKAGLEEFCEYATRE
ncbi:MAG: hypothetical protein HY911_00010 [Desulfobacterales bacterium]|nr:hypothetical protein [Desulfobacterales bacterium]